MLMPQYIRKMASFQRVLFILLGLIQIVPLVMSALVTHEGYKAYSISKEQLALALGTLGEVAEYIDFWSPTTIIVPPQVQQKFTQRLQAASIKYELYSDDIDRDLQQATRSISRSGASTPINRYLRYDEINNYLLSLVEDYPEICRITTIGQSYEGRDLKVLTIFPVNTTHSNKPAIVLDGGIHGREWISPATLIYIISQIVESDLETRELLSQMEWHILPVVNPDGYEFTHTGDRLWRKSRSPNAGSKCIGTDLNRNFDFHWGGNLTESDPCKETYGGSKAMSEVEITSWTNHLQSFQQRIKFYMAFHSFASGIYYPWAYTYDEVEDNDELVNLATQAVNVSNKRYNIDPMWISPPWLVRGGTAVDWVRGVLNVKWSFLIEIPQINKTRFNTPPAKIAEIGADVYKILKVFIQNVKNTYITNA